MTTQKAKEIDLVNYLSRLGFEPKKVSQNNYWYCSPLRNENMPSFKIQNNLWHDHGTGEGGTIIDFGIRFFNCDIAEFLKILGGSDENSFSFHQQKMASKLEVLKVKPLDNKALLEYLEGRKIPFQIAQNYCQEMYYRVGDKKYFGVCFENDRGGYEIRNKYFKGSTSPKFITYIESNKDYLLVTEGFIDFLSVLTLINCEREMPPFDAIVLNSLVNLQEATPLFESYNSVFLALDNDEAGKQTTNSLKAEFGSKVIDLSLLMGDCKDVNEWLIQQKS